MEVSILKESSIKIKSKNASLVVDPVSKTDGDIIILTNPEDSTIDVSKVEGYKVIIEGPGEYEVGGMSITVTDTKEGLLYTIFDDMYRVLLLAESTLAKLKEQTEAHALIVKVNEEVKDTIFSNLPSDIFIFFGDLDKVHVSTENIKRVPKVNLRKREEFIGSVVLLS